jgi:hypothetical protein
MELARIAEGEGFYWNDVHYVRTDLGCAAKGEVIITGAHGLEQVSDTTEVTPDMRVFVTDIK